jgi:hypothetical protein
MPNELEDPFHQLHKDDDTVTATLEVEKPTDSSTTTTTTSGEVDHNIDIDSLFTGGGDKDIAHSDTHSHKEGDGGWFDFGGHDSGLVEDKEKNDAFGSAWGDGLWGSSDNNTAQNNNNLTQNNQNQLGNNQNTPLNQQNTPNQFGNNQGFNNQNQFGNNQGFNNQNQFGNNQFNQNPTAYQSQLNNYNQINQGMKTSTNVLETFQNNAAIAVGSNEAFTQIAHTTTAELKVFLRSIYDKLLTPKLERIKTTPEIKEEVESKLAWLQMRIVQDMSKYRKWEGKSRKWALIFRLMSSALAAVVTVLLGFNITDSMRAWGVDWFINFAALLISAFISILGVIQGFFDANELYIKYTDTANKLEELAETIEYLRMGIDYVDLIETNLIYQAYFAIVDSTNEYEMKIKSQGEEKR